MWTRTDRASMSNQREVASCSRSRLAHLLVHAEAQQSRRRALDDLAKGHSAASIALLVHAQHPPLVAKRNLEFGAQPGCIVMNNVVEVEQKVLRQVSLGRVGGDGESSC